MLKQEIFDYLNSAIDKSGNSKKIGGFRKHFPEIYQELETCQLPKHIDILPFKQKLWHFLKEIYEIPTCKICGKHVSFLTCKNKWGYSTYCSGACAMQDDEVKKKLDETKEKRYGDKKYNNVNKQKETLNNKDNSYWIERDNKNKQTRYSKNNNQYFSQESINKTKETNIKRFGCDSFAKTSQFREIIKNKHVEIQEKQYITKSKNKSFNISKIEIKFKEYLEQSKINYIHQYKSKLYPYTCDFYLSDYDLYIEIQGTWTHGFHPFDKNNQDDINKLNLWKSKNLKYYKQAIYTWTDLDVRKRIIAKENNLNYLEIFSNKIEEVIVIFNERINMFKS